MDSRVRRFFVLLAAASLPILIATTPALAGEARTHDGFFLRLSGGGGGAKSEFEGIKLSGATGDLNIAVGASVARNLALHGTIWGWAVDSPDVEIAGVSGTAGGATLDMTGFGVGITYYFMPINIYISPSVGGAELSIKENGVTFTTDTGFSFDTTLGKEWWVGDGWGLGAALGFSYHTIPDGNLDGNWKGPGVSLRFSATMN